MTTDPGEFFKKPRATAVEIEEVARRGLEIAREKYESDRAICAKFVDAVGLTPGIMDLLVASGRDVAAAEARFASAVENREALDKLIKELREASAG